MKKIGLLFVIIISCCTIFNSKKQIGLNDMQINNIEILAQGESSSSYGDCSWKIRNGKCKKNGDHGHCICGSHAD